MTANFSLQHTNLAQEITAPEVLFVHVAIDRVRSLQISFSIHNLKILDTETRDGEFKNWISGRLRVKYIRDPIIPLYKVSFTGLRKRSGPKFFGGTMSVFTEGAIRDLIFLQ
ncbi:hypothetical protein Tco_1106822 [Tanacetum coccineum]